jgi:hypothetical protein
MADVIETLTEVFALANGAVEMANTLIKATKGKNKKSDADYARIGSSGDDAQIGSSGDYARIGSSGYSARIGSSGYSARIDSTGEKSVIAAIGINSIAKGKKGSWLTLAEYRKNKDGIYEVYHVKTEYIDGKTIKADTWYCLYNKEFHESMDFDNIRCAVISHKGNVYKVHNFNSDKESYVVTDGEHYSHGDTIKQAKADLIYKISNRDTSQYADLTLDSVVTKAEAIKMYRVITGACEAGTKHFVSSLTKTKAKYTIAELIKLTDGQYGNETFAKFFERKA